MSAGAPAATDVIMSSSACVIYLLLLIACLTCSRLYTRAGTLVAVCYWLVAVTSLAMTSSSSSGHVTSMAYYVTVTSYAMLPVSRRSVCVALGVTTGLVHLVVFVIVTALQSTDQLALQVNIRLLSQEFILILLIYISLNTEHWVY